MSERKNDLSLILTRVVDAPRALVFEAWTRKEHLDKWSAPKGFTIPASSGDLRVGGKWHCLMIAPNGEKYPVGGVYREIVRNEKLVMTHCWEDNAGKPEHETLVTVTFTDEGTKTRMTLEQATFRSIESRNGHEGGWTECFDLLSDLLATLTKKS